MGPVTGHDSQFSHVLNHVEKGFHTCHSTQCSQQ